MKKYSTILALVLCYCLGAQAAIYGKDDRILISNQFEWPQKDLSTVGFAAQIHHNKFRPQSKDLEFLDENTLCEDVPFRNQADLSECTGTMITPNKLITARHCVDELHRCTDFDWVFERTVDIDLLSLPRYKCKAVYFEKDSSKDYAIVELDRDVIGYDRLDIQKQQLPLKSGQEVYTIGHPDGRPLTYTAGSFVLPPKKIKSYLPSARKKPINLEDFDFLSEDKKDSERKFIWKDEWITKEYFYTRLDLFHGSSGSVIISKDTHKIVGVVSGGGGSDYKIRYGEDYEDSCRELVTYPDTDKVYGDSNVRVEVMNLLKQLDNLPAPMFRP